MHKLKTILNKIKLRIYEKNSWNHLLTMLKLQYPNHFLEDKKVLTLKYLNITMHHQEFQFLLTGYANALILKESIDADFIIENKKLFINLNTLTFEIQTAEELFILKEIFVEGVYNFHLVDDVKNHLLIDIGMNVSYAACYFAKVKQIPKVISFEPFTPTFHQAQKHIVLNHLEDMIDARNYGLGGCDEILSVPYAPQFRGQVGMQGTAYIRSEITHSITEEIEIKDAFTPLDSILKAYPSKRFIMKVDCEGAEYDLIDKIPKEMLNRCDLIMMEWHEKGPKLIENWLKKHGFISMSFYPHSKRAGMLYAVKANS